MRCETVVSGQQLLTFLKIILSPFWSWWRLYFHSRRSHCTFKAARMRQLLRHLCRALSRLSKVHQPTALWQGTFDTPLPYVLTLLHQHQSSMSLRNVCNNLPKSTALFPGTPRGNMQKLFTTKITTDYRTIEISLFSLWIRDNLLVDKLWFVSRQSRKVKVKVALWGFSTLRPFGLLYSYPQQVPAFISRGATRHTDARDLYQRRRELLTKNFAKKNP